MHDRPDVGQNKDRHDDDDRCCWLLLAAAVVGSLTMSMAGSLFVVWSSLEIVAAAGQAAPYNGTRGLHKKRFVRIQLPPHASFGDFSSLLVAALCYLHTIFRRALLLPPHTNSDYPTLLRRAIVAISADLCSPYISLWCSPQDSSFIQFKRFSAVVLHQLTVW